MWFNLFSAEWEMLSWQKVAYLCGRFLLALRSQWGFWKRAPKYSVSCKIPTFVTTSVELNNIIRVRVTHSVFCFHDANGEVSTVVSLVIEVTAEPWKMCWNIMERWKPTDIISPFLGPFSSFPFFIFPHRTSYFNERNSLSLVSVLESCWKKGAFKKLYFVVKHVELFLVTLVLIKVRVSAGLLLVLQTVSLFSTWKTAKVEADINIYIDICPSWLEQFLIFIVKQGQK